MDLIKKSSIGLMPVAEDESETQPEQNLEAALKKKREKIAQSRLGIPAETDTAV